MPDEVEVTVAGQSLPPVGHRIEEERQGPLHRQHGQAVVFANLGNAPTFSDTKVEIEPAAPATANR
jgi:hypothetical protein